VGNVLKKVWAWIKKNWKIFALVVATLVGYLIFRSQNISFSEDFSKIKAAHDEEINEIEAARVEERTRLAANQEKLEKALKVVEDEYARQSKDLDKKKKKEIETIVKESDGDPEELAERLSTVTGFRIILPME